MRILVVGGRGFVGRRLIELARERGHEVVVTGRDAARLEKTLGDTARIVAWDPLAGPPPADAIAGVDGVVNLAGESVAKGRWTKRKKARIRDSRVLGTRHLVTGLEQAESKPAALVNASAIGIYGDRGHLALYENSVPAADADFLAGVCAAWEAEAARARECGVRTAIVRLGAVLGRGGGAYPQMTRPFRMFLGGQIGLGRRWLSWIHLDDAAALFLHCLENERAGEVYNGTAPHPVSNREWTETVASVLHRPRLAPVFPPMLKAVLGGFATVVLSSQKVLPVRTLGLGFAYRFPRLREAVEDLERA